jgi:hypothetical protein
MTTTTVAIQNFSKEFAKASINKYFNTIAEILDKNDEFEIPNQELE